MKSSTAALVVVFVAMSDADPIDQPHEHLRRGKSPTLGTSNHAAFESLASSRNDAIGDGLEKSSAGREDAGGPDRRPDLEADPAESRILQDLGFSALKMACGADYGQAVASCDVECTMNWDCPAGTYCWIIHGCAAADGGLRGGDVGTNGMTMACGASYGQAAVSRDVTCATDFDCPAGTHCWIVSGDEGASQGGGVGGVGGGGVGTNGMTMACGATYMQANELCDVECRTDVDCPVGTHCWIVSGCPPV